MYDRGKTYKKISFVIAEMKWFLLFFVSGVRFERRLDLEAIYSFLTLQRLCLTDLSKESALVYSERFR
jgi:hypothetical protein